MHTHFDLNALLGAISEIEDFNENQNNAYILAFSFSFPAKHAHTCVLHRPENRYFRMGVQQQCQHRIANSMECHLNPEKSSYRSSSSIRGQ